MLTVRCVAAVVLTASLTPAIARAQEALNSRSCFAGVTDADLVRVPVYIEVSPRDSAARPLLPVLDALAELVGVHVRRSLGGLPGEAPMAEPRVRWANLGPGVLVHAHRDGRLAWTQIPTSREDAEPLAGTHLLYAALQAVVDSGEKVFVPEDAASDSVAFYISYQRPLVGARREILPVPVRHAVPVFSLAVPWESPARARRLRPQYPTDARLANAVGLVIVQVVVDTTGRPEPESVKPQWPEDKPPLTGELDRLYRSFVASVVKSVQEARFDPATIAGCRVRQLVHIPIHFVIPQ